MQRYEISEREADALKVPFQEDTDDSGGDTDDLSGDTGNSREDPVDPNAKPGIFNSLNDLLEDWVWNSEGLEVPDTPDTSQVINFENLDPICMYQKRKNPNTVQPLFKDKESTKDFESYFNHKCFGKQSCEFNPNKISNSNLKNIDRDDINYEVNQGLFGLINDECKLRMSDERYRISDTKPQLITSTTYIGIFGCKYDTVKIPFTSSPTHKEVIGVIIVCLDFLSILVMMFFFSKINSINNEFLECMDDLRVTMKDFGVKIDNVKLDRYTQDSRIIKMKVWLHFKEILEEY